MAGDPPAGAALLRSGRSPLLGREGPLAVLAEHLASARAGQAAVVLLAGAPGIGKTRLLEEFPPPALMQAVTVLRGGASPAEGMPPYLPFLEALGAYVSAAPHDRLAAEAGPHAATLAALLPELPARLGPPPPTFPLGPEQERFRLFEAVAAFLGAIAARGPVALLFDDLHWADAATCDLLVHVAGRLRAAPLLVVGAHREGEADDNPAFVRARVELSRRRLLTVLPLAPLAAADSRALVAHLLRGPVGVEAAELVQRQGEGNPFFLEELLQALVAEGTLRRETTGWALSGTAGRALPPRVVEAIRMRLARLDPDVVELLSAAAVAGRTSEPGVMARVLGVAVERAEELLQAATRARLVRPSAEGAYAFTHDMVRETLLADVLPTRRRRLHLALGEALEALSETETPQRLADLAFHFAEAGAAERGVGYVLASAEGALRAAAYGEALGHFQTALRLLGPAAATPPRAQALAGVGTAATAQSNYDQAVEAYRLAQAAWLQLGEPARAAQVWHQLGRVRWRQEAVSEARQAFERALELLGPVDSADAAESLLQLGNLHGTSLGHPAEGLALAERALLMVQRLGHRRLEAGACCVLGNLRARGNDLAGGQALLERALALALELDDPVLAAEASAYLANALAWQGDLASSLAFSIRRAEFAQRTQDPFDLRHIYAWIGFNQAQLGQWAAAESSFEQQRRIVEGLASPEPLATLRSYRGWLYYHQARFEAAEQDYREAIGLVRPTGSNALVWYLGRWALSLIELGQRAEALAGLAELQTLANGLGQQARVRGFALAHLAAGYARLGETAQAAACYAPLLPFRGQLAPLLVDRALGLAARAAGQTRQAGEHLAEAEAAARRAGLRPELALTLLERGQLARERGDTAEALDEGLRLCAELGMEALGRRMLAQAPVAPGRAARVAGLSDRELEVLRLVAAGATNREIAARLVISEKTVARHLTHIYAKAGVDNRAGAAAFALRHGLA